MNQKKIADGIKSLLIKFYILEQSLNKNMKRSNSQQDIQKDKTLNDILTEIFKDLQH